MSHSKDNMVCLLSFFLTNTNIVLDLSFHFLLLVFCKCQFFEVCACEVPFSITSVVCCQIHFGKFNFLSFAQWMLF